MENSVSRKILLSILGLAILIVALIGVSYAVSITSTDNFEVSVINTETASLSLIESASGILVSGKIPISDEDGKKLDGGDNVFDFKVSSSIVGPAMINYEIVAEKVDVDGIWLDDDSVRIYLEKLVDGQYVSTLITKEPRGFISNGVVSELGSLAESMTLYYGSFQNVDNQRRTFTDTYRLRMWVSEDAVIDDANKVFQIRINVYGKVL